MYFEKTESQIMPSMLEYMQLENGEADVFMRKNITQENKTDERGINSTSYIYQEVQFRTNLSKSYIENNFDDIFRQYSGNIPTIEERINALENAIAEIGELL